MKGTYILPTLLILLSGFILFKQFMVSHKYSEKSIIIMLFILIVYCSFSYMRLDEATESFMNKTIKYKKNNEAFQNNIAEADNINSNTDENTQDEDEDDISNQLEIEDTFNKLSSNSLTDYLNTSNKTNSTEMTNNTKINNNASKNNTSNIKMNNNNASKNNTSTIKMNNNKASKNNTSNIKMNNNKASKNKNKNNKMMKNSFEDVPTTTSPPNMGDVFNRPESSDLEPVKSIFSPMISIKNRESKPVAGDRPEIISQEDYEKYKSNYYNADFWRSVPDYNRSDYSRTGAGEDNDENPYKYSNEEYLATRGARERPNRSEEEVYTQNPANRYPPNKIFYPGYAYVPPSNWDVPQLRPPVCYPNRLDTRRLPIGIMDHGTPVNALELNPEGVIAYTEDTVNLTNVGSILPKFEYKVLPYAQP